VQNIQVFYPPDTTIFIQLEQIILQPDVSLKNFLSSRLTMMLFPASLQRLVPVPVVSVFSPPTRAFSLDLLDASAGLAGVGADWRRGRRLMAGGRATEGRSSDADRCDSPGRGEKEKAGLRNKTGRNKL